MIYQYVICASLLLSSLVAGQGDYTCSKANNFACANNACCSQYGFCGTTADHCMKSRGCQANCWPNDKEPLKLALKNNKKERKSSRKSRHRESRHEDNDDSDDPFATFDEGVFYKCETRGKIALTFDDGPSDYTMELLDVLKKYNVKATFFVLGEKLSEPEYARALLRAYHDGHLIASHTWDHPSLEQISTYEVRQQMERTAEAIKRVIGVKPRYMRPPYGEYNDESRRVLLRMGYKIVMWNLDTNDWQYAENDPAVIYNTFANALPGYLHKGWLPLQHDTYRETVSSQEDIIKLAISLGYSFVRVDECLGHGRSSAYY